MAPSGDLARPRVLHFCEQILAPSETFVQQRLEGDRFSPVIAGWQRVSGGLEVPCPSVIIPRRVEIGGSSLAARAVRRLARPLVRTRRSLDLIALLARSAPTIVHAHFGTVGAAVSQACALLGIPLVVSFYGYDVGWVPRQPGGGQAYAHLFASAA